MVTYKGLDCKDDLKLIRYDDYKVKLSLMPRILYFGGLLFDLATKEPS